MNKKFLFVLVSALSLSFLISTCSDDLDHGNSTTKQLQLELPQVPYDYATFSELPKHILENDFVRVTLLSNEGGNAFPTFPNETNPRVSDHGATLGRVLFYDPRLSLNNSIACASCHHQEKAFADGKTISPGFENKMTFRNSMAINNPALMSNLFWDSRRQSVKDMTLNPIKDHIEMGMEDMEYLTTKLSKFDIYPSLFKNAYGSTEINENRIADALAQFICSMTSFNSKFDQNQLVGFAGFTTMELLGKSIFESKGNCMTCHGGINFDQTFFNGGGGYEGDFSFSSTANIGLKLTTDLGRNGRGLFKIPSLRNIALTAPYMHDGRFSTLEEVIEHYDHGVQINPNLSEPLIDQNTGKAVKLNLSNIEKKALVAFLQTLTDEKFIKEAKFSNPFK